MNAIETDNLCVSYQGVDVLADVTFALAEGEYVGLVGPNGSGKTTLVRTILGLHPIRSGAIRVFGRAQKQFRQWRRVGYLPQASAHLHPAFPATVGEVVASGLLARKRFPKRLTAADAEAVDKVLDLLDIADLRRRRIGRLSGGQQQRALLARALVGDPDVLFLDEPTASLDPGTRDDFYRTLQQLNAEHGKAILLVTHDSGTIGRYADKLLYLDRRVVFYGSFDEFCTSSEMEQYFGEAAQRMICHRHE